MHTYLKPLSEFFISNARPEVAVYMKKYMKGQYDYFGIKSAERKELSKDFLQKHGLPLAEELTEIVRECWEFPQREYQYFIMEVLARLVKKGEYGAHRTL